MKEKETENTGIYVACFVVPGGVYTQKPLNKILDPQKTFYYLTSCDAL